MAIKAGTLADFTGSMAQAMENALEEEYQRLKGEAMPAMGREDRQLMFAAIAQGVVRHLKDNHDAFKVAVTVDGEPGSGKVDALNTTGELYS